MKRIIEYLIAAALGIMVGIILTPESLITIEIGVLTVILILSLFYCIGMRAGSEDQRYIKVVLREARKKNANIRKYRTKWHMWRIWLKIDRIQKINTKIISTLSQYPERFGLADKFFSLYLDSVQNILKRYETLALNSVRSAKIQNAMTETVGMLDGVIKGLERELNKVLYDEIKELGIEKEVLDQYRGTER